MLIINSEMILKKSYKIREILSNNSYKIYLLSNIFELFDFKDLINKEKDLLKKAEYEKLFKFVILLIIINLFLIVAFLISL